MERTIEILRSVKETTEKKFVENSKFKRNAEPSDPIIDTDYHLDLLIELEEAIKILKNYVK